MSTPKCCNSECRLYQSPSSMVYARTYKAEEEGDDGDVYMVTYEEYKCQACWYIEPVGVSAVKIR